MLNIQDRISNEQEEQAEHHDSKTTQVDHSPPCEDITVTLVFLARLRVVQGIISLHIFWEQQQPCRRVDVEFF